MSKKLPEIERTPGGGLPHMTPAQRRRANALIHKTCTAHFIRAVVLEKLVLEHLQRTVQYVREYENEFVQSMGEKSAADRRKEISAKRRGLSQAQRRMEELDRLFQRLYEDNVSGKISDERFTKLSGGYEAEQKELQEKVAILQAELTGAGGTGYEP